MVNTGNFLVILFGITLLLGCVSTETPKENFCNSLNMRTAWWGDCYYENDSGTHFCKQNNMKAIVWPDQSVDQSGCIDSNNELHEFVMVENRYVFIHSSKLD